MIYRNKATVSNVEGRQVTLKLEDGQVLVLQRDDLTGGLKSLEITVGQNFVLQLLPEEEAVLAQEDLARTLLNQILEDKPANGKEQAQIEIGSSDRDGNGQG